MTDFTTIRSSSSIIARSAASARSRVVMGGIILGAEGEHLMKHSTDRILTTHTGSLPRPWDLIATLEALDAGTTPDPEAFDARVRRAVAEALRKQVAAGVDIINDGEQGKVGYSTYIRHRLTGFEGSSVVPPRSDWADFPEAMARQGRSTVARPSCTGHIEWRDRAAVGKDIGNLRAALAEVRPTEVFMTAASPGVIAHFLRNEYYPSREAYLARLTEVMKQEYDAIARAGFVLQLDCPDLAMGRHLAFPDLSTSEFLKIAEGNVEALNHACGTSRPTDCACTSAGAITKGRTTATSRSETSSPSCSGRARRPSRWRAPTLATSTSGPCSRRCGCRTTKLSFRASWTRRPTSSSIRSWWLSGSCAMPRWSVGSA